MKTIMSTEKSTFSQPLQQPNQTYDKAYHHKTYPPPIVYSSKGIKVKWLHLFP